MSQLAVPEQSLIRLNLIIAPTLSPSQGSTAAGEECCAQWKKNSALFHGQKTEQRTGFYFVIVCLFRPSFCPPVLATLRPRHAWVTPRRIRAACVSIALPFMSGC